MEGLFRRSALYIKKVTMMLRALFATVCLSSLPCCGKAFERQESRHQAAVDEPVEAGEAGEAGGKSLLDGDQILMPETNLTDRSGFVFTRKNSVQFAAHPTSDQVPEVRALTLVIGAKDPCVQLDRLCRRQGLQAMPLDPMTEVDKDEPYLLFSIGQHKDSLLQPGRYSSVLLSIPHGVHAGSLKPGDVGSLNAVFLVSSGLFS